MLQQHIHRAGFYTKEICRGGNSLNYVYDANGNQIRITGTADGTSVNKVFAYTPSGLMSSYTSGAGTQVNRYNGDGQRVSKTEGSDVTNYFYQEWKCALHH